MTLFKIKLSDFEDSEDNVNKSIEKSIWSTIKKWIEDNYKVNDLSYEYDNKKDIYKVSSKGDVRVKNEKITSLTNGDFEWDIVGGNFDCSFAEITSLKGTPREVKNLFNCSYCYCLTSLEGSPKKVGVFDCSFCRSLISLKGTPRILDSFTCYYCDSLTSLKGVPDEVKGDFNCAFCKSLTSLKGAPKYVGGWFDYSYCDSLKTLEGAPEEVDGEIYCTNCESLEVSKK